MNKNDCLSTTGDSNNCNQELVSAGCKLHMQSDGNLVVYKNDTNEAIWNSNTANQGQGPYRYIMQADGNLVVYGSSGPIWSSNTNNQGQGPFKLSMQDDCNLVVYDSNNTATWNSNTTGGVKR